MTRNDPTTLALVAERRRLQAKLTKQLKECPKNKIGAFGLRCKINTIQHAISIHHRVFR